VKPRGFTLIEVLVALAIVVLGMAAVLGALSSSANTISYLRDRTFAGWIALNQIATVRLQSVGQKLPDTGTTTGDLDYAGRKWHWRQDVTAIGNDQIKGIVQIDVKVRPAEVQGGDDNGWVTTMTGFVGDAVAASQGGAMPVWGNNQNATGTATPGSQTPGNSQNPGTQNPGTPESPSPGLQNPRTQNPGGPTSNQPQLPQTPPIAAPNGGT
jgi:general secretion pathway protein I